MMKPNFITDVNYAYKYSRFTVKRMYVNLEGIVDYQRLKQRVPSVSVIDQKITQASQILSPYYQIYTTSISPDDMAISLQLASFIFAFCDTIKPKRILDLGSGFSSFVFRLYAKKQPAKVDIWSVDDDLKWLIKTRGFLARYRLKPYHLVSWQAFKRQPLTQFDLILNDLDIIQTRIKTLVWVLKLLSPNGWLILDDMQIPMYESFVKPLAKEKNIEFFSLRRLTVDRYRRYSSLLCFRG